MEDTQVPAGSVWGLQDALRFKIRAGEPVKQWVYKRDGKDYCIWFAYVEDSWWMTLRLELPKGIVTDHDGSSANKT